MIVLRACLLLLVPFICASSDYSSEELFSAYNYYIDESSNNIAASDFSIYNEEYIELEVQNVGYTSFPRHSPDEATSSFRRTIVVPDEISDSESSDYYELVREQLGIYNTLQNDYNDDEENSLFGLSFVDV